jgi:hypothetical protein
VFRVRIDFNADPDGILGQCGSGCGSDPDPDPDAVVLMIKTVLKIYIFLSNIVIYLSHKGHSSCRRSLQPSKDNIQHFKTLISELFSLIVALFCLLGSSPSKSMCGFGSETLQRTVEKSAL